MQPPNQILDFVRKSLVSVVFEGLRTSLHHCTDGAEKARQKQKSIRKSQRSKSLIAYNDLSHL